LTPASEVELSEAVAAADGTPAHPGRRHAPRRTAGAGEALSVAGLAGVELYEPGALTMVVKAGTPLAEVEAILARENQRLPFEPMDHRALLGTTGEPTIGGVVAANVSGPRRIQAGACRDFSLIGVRFVDGTGTVLKNGGRVMKNVTGYDLVKLMAGLGHAGRADRGGVQGAAGHGDPGQRADRGAERTHQAVEAMSTALGSPFEVTGAAHLRRGRDGPVTMIRMEGFAASVAYRTGAAEELLAHPSARCGRRPTPTPFAAVWRGVRRTRSCGPACIAGSARRPARPTRCWATSSTARAGGST
jgi:glycolate oxidase FAD binding subunit